MLGTPGGVEWILVMGLAILLLVLPVVCFWEICRKAGFPGYLSLLMLIPPASLIVIIVLAFAPWPSLQEREKNNAEDE